MGIINCTPDSFSDGGDYITEKDVLNRAELIIKEGAKIIDIGGMSSQPGAKLISQEVELSRVIHHIENIKKEFPDTILSLDTIHADVAKEGLDRGIAMINDISFGDYNKDLPKLAKKFQAPYIGMHMQGLPSNMQNNPQYPDGVVLSILQYFIQKIKILNDLGLEDILIDPGFGFGKTIRDNYDILNGLESFQILNKPLVVGLSRKSMIWKLLNVNPKETIHASSALHLQALLNGAQIIRVHDVEAAKQIITIYDILNN